MKRTLLFFFILPITLSAFGQDLIRIWETDTLFLKPESALYDTLNQIMYISNINGKYLAKDGNGYISTLKPNGEVDNLKWAVGLDNPQGMGLYKNHLYIADIDRVVKINTNTSKIEKVYEIEGAEFLNDIASDKNGDIYVSDCRKNKIHKISGDKTEVWLEDSLLLAPNGLMCTDEKIFILNMGNGIVYQADKLTKTLSEFTNGIENLDGIVSDGQDGYFISGAWQGEIFHVNSEGEKELVLDLGGEKIITADIEYIIEDKLLIIPTLYKSVIAYRWE